MNIIKNECKQMIKVCKEYVSVFLVELIFGAVTYFLLISNQLVNSNDGLWEYNYYKSGSWSLSLGRWFLPYLDRVRFGISTEPFTSLLTLSCFSAGFIFILDLFELGKRKISYFAGMLFLSSAAVCVTLSYRFTSPSYGLAFLLNVMAAWVIIKWKNKVASVVVGGGLIAFAMGAYQAYIGSTCMVLVGYFIYALQKEDISFRKVVEDIVKAFLSAFTGGFFYVLILNIHLKIFHISMADYSGANTYSLVNTLKNLLSSFGRAYEVFARYFGGYFKTNVLQAVYVYAVVWLVVVLFLIIGFVKTVKFSKKRAVLYLLFVLAIPVASNAVLMVATGAWTSLLMTAPMALCLPVMWCVESKIVVSDKKWYMALNTLLMVVLLYGNFYQVQIDQEAMLEGKIATTSMADEIIHDLNDYGYLDADLKYCVLGIPAWNDMFKTSVIYEKANQEALFGSWYSDIGCSRRSWQGVFNYLCGTNLQIGTYEEYGMVLGTEQVQTMNKYPNEGYICKIGDIVVIKVSE